MPTMGLRVPAIKSVENTPDIENMQYIIFAHLLSGLVECHDMCAYVSFA